MKVTVNARGQITIVLPKTTLKTVTKFHPKLEHFDEKSGDCLLPQVTDAAALAKEVARELTSEEENGDTLLTKAIDKAIVRAVESGAEGVLLPGDAGYRRQVR